MQDGHAQRQVQTSNARDGYNFQKGDGGSSTTDVRTINAQTSNYSQDGGGGSALSNDTVGYIQRQLDSMLATADPDNKAELIEGMKSDLQLEKQPAVINMLSILIDKYG